MVNLMKSTDRPAVTLVKRTGRHASANELRPTTGGDYAPRHGRGPYVVTVLRSGRFLNVNV